MPGKSIRNIGWISLAGLLIGFACPFAFAESATPQTATPTAPAAAKPATPKAQNPSGKYPAFRSPASSISESAYRSDRSWKRTGKATNSLEKVEQEFRRNATSAGYRFEHSIPMTAADGSRSVLLAWSRPSGGSLLAMLTQINTNLTAYFWGDSNK